MRRRIDDPARPRFTRGSSPLDSALEATPFSASRRPGCHRSDDRIHVLPAPSLLALRRRCAAEATAGAVPAHPASLGRLARSGPGKTPSARSRAQPLRRCDHRASSLADVRRGPPCRCRPRPRSAARKRVLAPTRHLEHRIQHPVVRYSNRRVRLDSLPLTVFPTEHGGHPDQNALTSRSQVPVSGRPKCCLRRNPFTSSSPTFTPSSASGPTRP